MKVIWTRVIAVEKYEWIRDGKSKIDKVLVIDYIWGMMLERDDS